MSTFRLDARLSELLQGPQVNYGIVACAIILAYDYMCTFEREVHYLWLSPSKNILGSVAFIVNRYIPFLTVFLFVQREMTFMSPEACALSSDATTILIFLDELIIQFVLYARTYAVWSGSPKMRRFIIALMCSALTTVGLVVAIVKSQHYGPMPVAGRAGCHLVSGSKLVLIAFPLVMLLESIALILTLIKIWPLYRRYRTPLIAHLYEDGILFCIFILGTSVVNMLIVSKAPSSAMNFLALMGHVLHSILTMRVILVRATYGERPLSISEDVDVRDIDMSASEWGSTRDSAV